MKQQFQVTESQKRALAVATIVALVFGAYFLRHYFSLVVFAAIMAFLFNPFYQRRLKKTNKPDRSAALTFGFAAVVILIPLAIVLGLTVWQINHSIDQVSTSVQSTDVSAVSQKLINGINNLIAKTPSDFRLTPEWIQDTAIEFAQKVGNAFLHNLASYVGNFFSFFTTAIIFIFVFLSMLKNQKTLRESVRSLNPLGTEISDLYLNRISAMTKAMVRGQFIIALAQGFTDAALIYLGGFHEGFFFLFMILVLLSFIPLGGGILAIPIGIVMALTGNVIGGIVVVLGHLIIVTNIDNFLRPRLVPAEARLDSALVILSVFSGIALLGFLGVVVGPVIMVAIVTTISIYLDVYRGIHMQAIAVEAEEPHGRRFWPFGRNKNS